MVDAEDYAAISRSWLDEWMLGKIIAAALQDLGLEEGAAWETVALLKILVAHQGWHAERHAGRVLESWLRDDEVQRFLLVNRHRGVLWFNKEAFEKLLRGMRLVALVAINADPLRPADEIARETNALGDVLEKLHQAQDESGYQVERLMEAARGELGALPLGASGGKIEATV